jgi:hypothetical protein
VQDNLGRANDLREAVRFEARKQVSAGELEQKEVVLAEVVFEGFKRESAIAYTGKKFVLGVVFPCFFDVGSGEVVDEFAGAKEK